MIGTITFNPSIDQHIVVKHLVMDDANRALAIYRFPGGKGINVSKVVRELGGPTRAFTLLGGIPGRLLADLTGKLDIPFTAVPVEGATRINTILTDIQDKTQTRISAPGPKLNAKEINAMERKLLGARPKPFLWALGGSLPRGTDPAAYRRIVRCLQANGTPCILDADDEALKLGIQAKPFMIKPNEYEITRLTGKTFKTVKDYLKAAKTLVKGGIRIAIVSLAEKGALFVTAEDAFHIQVPRAPIKSKVGAGDSLIGGVAYGLYRKKPLREAALIGMAASVSAVMREAPRLCRRQDVPGLVKRMRLKPL